MPGCDGAGVAERSYPTPEVRGGSQEEQLQVQGAVAAWAQEGLEELSHIEGQEGQRRSGRAEVRRYPSSKVRSKGCALLEQP